MLSSIYVYKFIYKYIFSHMGLYRNQYLFTLQVFFQTFSTLASSTHSKVQNNQIVTF